MRERRGSRIRDATPPTRCLAATTVSGVEDTTLRNALICALALAAATAVSGHAIAASDDASHYSIKVHTADLNLEDRHDAQVLLQRINHAAMEACGASIWSSPQEWSAVRESGCHADAVARAVATVHSAALSAAYRNSIALATE
jgi:UrcA family protein